MSKLIETFMRIYYSLLENQDINGFRKISGEWQFFNSFHAFRIKEESIKSITLKPLVVV